MSNDLQRIQRDMARAKERIGQLERGERGIVSPGANHQEPGRAYEAQLRAQRQALERFEAEYVQACLGEHKYSPAEIIKRMEAPAAAPEAAQPTLTLGDATRARLSVLLEENPGPYIPRSKLKEILQK